MPRRVRPGLLPSRLCGRAHTVPSRIRLVCHPFLVLCLSPRSAGILQCHPPQSLSQEHSYPPLEVHPHLRELHGCACLFVLDLLRRGRSGGRYGSLSQVLPFHRTFCVPGVDLHRFFEAGMLCLGVWYLCSPSLSIYL